MKKHGSSINGLGQFVAVMRTLDPQFKQKILRDLEKVNPLLARLGERVQFLFEDIARLDDRSLQSLLSQIDEGQLLLAWKLASEKLRERILSNMSQRKSIDFSKQFQELGKVHVARVMRSQLSIARLAQDGLTQGRFRMLSRRK